MKMFLLWFKCLPRKLQSASLKLLYRKDSLESLLATSLIYCVFKKKKYEEEERIIIIIINDNYKKNSPGGPKLKLNGRPLISIWCTVL